MQAAALSVGEDSKNLASLGDSADGEEGKEGKEDMGSDPNWLAVVSEAETSLENNSYRASSLVAEKCPTPLSSM
jgi:hypothetical protein